jgi:hypothetical protein
MFAKYLAAKRYRSSPPRCGSRDADDRQLVAGYHDERRVEVAPGGFARSITLELDSKSG